MHKLVLPLALVFAAAPIVARARLVQTESVLAAEDAARDRARVRDFLSREDVRRQMGLLGVDADEAWTRVDTLTDTEVQSIAGRLDALPAGQDAIGILVSALLFIFLVLLITDLLGLTRFYPFTR